MQTLESRNTYTPPNASQVRSNCDSILNKEETLSVLSLKTGSILSDVNLLRKEKQTSQEVFVYVLDISGKPLMPTTPKNARKLLKDNKAKVVKRQPFVIQLSIIISNTSKSLKLGIDTGFQNLGFSVISPEKELICGEVKLRTDIPELLEKRSMYRRNKRNRLRYRKSRFDNRNIPEGWLAPSIRHKVETTKNFIAFLMKYLPISEIIIETAKFDTQKLQNPEISGIEYQQGELQGYEIREYLLEKYGRTCVYCKKSNIPLEIEHILPKSKGGSDRVSNLTIACHKCNQDKGNMTAEEFGYPEVQKQAKKPLKSTAFMNIVRKILVYELRNDINIPISTTYGYITKHNRIKYNIEKSHFNDAFAIAGGTNQERCRPYFATQTRRNDRCLQQNNTSRTGGRSIRRQRYSLQSNDLVKYNNNNVCICKGTLNKGIYCRLSDLKNNKITVKRKTESDRINVKDVKLLTYGKGIQLRLIPENKENCKIDGGLSLKSAILENKK